MFNKKVYEFSQVGLKQMQEDNKRADDVKKLYEVMVTSVLGIFVIFLI